MTAPVPEFSLAEVLEAIGDSRPDAECLVFGDLRLTWTDFTERTRRLANHLIGRGLGCHVERSELANHESGQDHLAIYLHNGNEYLEAMLGSLKARVGSLNVNYRYVAEELQYLLADSNARAIVVHSQFAPTLAEVLPALPDLDVILQVPDESGNDAAARRRLVRGRAGRRHRRSARPSTGALTTSTCSTPAAPPACPRA